MIPLSLLAMVLLFLPFVGYVLVSKRYGENQGVITAMVGSVVALLVVYVLLDSLEKHLIAALVLVLCLGGLSLAFKSTSYFRLEPAIKALLTAAYLLFFLYRDESLFQEIFTSVLDPALRGAIAPSEPKFDELMTEVMPSIFSMAETHFIAWNLAYGLLMIPVAFRLSNVMWLILKMCFVPFVFVGFALSAIPHYVFVM